MIDYYIRNSKKPKKNILGLADELKKYFVMEGIKVEKTNYYQNNKLAKILTVEEYERISSYFDTIEKNKKKYPFLTKYIKTNLKKNFKSHKFADLFAGCGGLSLGLENAGFVPVFVNEIDPTFAETHYFNNNISVDNYYVGDINKLISEIENYKSTLSNLDLVCGGPPCQGFSMANRQRIIDDPRNNLYKAYLKFLKYTKPKFFIIENVKGMSKKIDEILSDIVKYIGKDYDVHYTLLNASDYGIPQNRERFFIIGNRIGIKSADIVSNIIKKKNNKKITLESALYGLPILFSKTEKNNSDYESIETGFTLQKKRLMQNDYLKEINKSDQFDYLLNHKNRFNNKRDIEIFNRLPQGANSLHESIADIMPYKSRNHIFKDKYYKLKLNEVSKTITSHMKLDCNMYIHPKQARGLSPREAARIQSFPDSFYFRGPQNKWYAQIGNAVPVKLAEIIGNEIRKFL
jgi:DNA (cytosine-5)-methyltransferase 1